MTPPGPPVVMAVVPGREPVGQTLLACVSTLRPGAVIDMLAHAGHDLDHDTDPAVVAVLAAAEELAVRWRQDNERLEEHWLAFEGALVVESETRRRLDVVLHTLADLSTPPLIAGRRKLDLDQTSSEDSSCSGTAPSDSGDVSSPPTAAGAADIAVCVLGRFLLFHRGRLVSGWHGTKTPRVARYLFAHHGHAVAREQLIELFWPGTDPETGRRNLHQAIYCLRKVLRCDGDPTQAVVYADDAYSTHPGIGLWCDATEFEAEVKTGRRDELEGRQDDAVARYRAAERTYVGDFLEDSPYEEWAIVERDRLRMLYLDMANRLADILLTRGDVEVALEVSQKALRREPCDEACHRRVLRCHAAAGNRHLVMHQYRACVDALERAFGLEPTPETVELYATLTS